MITKCLKKTVFAVISLFLFSSSLYSQNITVNDLIELKKSTKNSINHSFLKSKGWKSIKDMSFSKNNKTIHTYVFFNKSTDDSPISVISILRDNKNSDIAIKYATQNSKYIESLFLELKSEKHIDNFETKNLVVDVFQLKNNIFLVKNGKNLIPEDVFLDTGIEIYSVSEYKRQYAKDKKSH